MFFQEPQYLEKHKLHDVNRMQVGYVSYMGGDVGHAMKDSSWMESGLPSIMLDQLSFSVGPSSAEDRLDWIYIYIYQDHTQRQREVHCSTLPLLQPVRHVM